MSFLRHLSITLLAKIILLICGVMTSVIIVRFLGPEGQGIYTLSITTVTLLGLIFGLGLPNATKYAVVKSSQSLKALFLNSMVFVFLAAIVITAWYFSLGGWPMNLFINSKILIRISLISLPFLLILNYSQNLLWGLNKIFSFNYIAMIRSIILAVLLFILVGLFHFKIGGALFAWLIATAFAAGLSVYNLNFKFEINKFRPDLALLRSLFPTGIRSCVSELLWFISSRIDIYFVGFFLGAAQVGYYSIAVLVISMANFIPDAIGNLIFNRAVITEERNLQNIMLASRLTALFSVLISIMIIISGKYIISFIFGRDFVRSFKCLLLLLPGLFFLNSLSVITNYIAGKEKYPMFNNIVLFSGLVVSVIFNLLLIPRYQINGAAIASSLSQFIQFILVMAYIGMKLKLDSLKFIFFGTRDFVLIKQNFISLKRQIFATHK